MTSETTPNLIEAEKKIRAALDLLIKEGFKPVRNTWGITHEGKTLVASSPRCCGLGAFVLSLGWGAGTQRRVKVTPAMLEGEGPSFQNLAGQKLGWSLEESTAFIFGWDRGLYSAATSPYRAHWQLGNRLAREYVDQERT